ncbi:MAG TPA: M28 family peptidase, partial [Gemmatimonadaceae bacterium]|nr:M28 family peptidase [Gemmatimonadaceae bacterium]
MRSPAHRAALTLLGLLALCTLLVRYAATPPAPVPAGAPATEFSAERALRHVREIARRPHPVGSAENARIREYLLAELRALGLAPEVHEATGVGTRYPEAGRVQNVLARLPGRTPGGLAVVLMAHYDGVAGAPAASDDAAGTAAVLETLRALTAGPPLTNDVIALITDGEEAGLLGAAAFVREHPWAKDVGVALNFEARGTRGRSYMFETGPGNLDVVRVLSAVPDVSATSLSVTVYRMLPNDTDLSELAVLGRPALNFAFADGVERYHTAHDDVAHLDPGSLQHHGTQALALARAFGNGTLPRPTTGDAVFFDLP